MNRVKCGVLTQSVILIGAVPESCICPLNSSHGWSILYFCRIASNLSAVEHEQKDIVPHLLVWKMVFLLHVFVAPLLRTELIVLRALFLPDKLVPYNILLSYAACY